MNQLTALREAFDQIDQATQRFCDSTGLHCQKGCGACCTKPHIQTTVLEMMPAAQWLIETNQTDDILNKIKTNKLSGRCVFYQPTASDETKGQCGAYHYRPGICRLFAFAANRDKYQKLKLVTCKVIKENFPDDVKSAESYLAKGQPAPMIDEHGLNMMAIDQQNGSVQLSINEALSQAIAKMLLRKQYQSDNF